MLRTAVEGNALLPPGSTPQYELNRSRFMEFLYKLYGRDKPSHSKHMLYTGLAEEFRAQLASQMMEGLVRDWDFYEPEMLTMIESRESRSES